ncbi:heat shock 70 kDa protein 12B-like [Saccostrea cucullata]|uniref:heat shock 70 kDa protein 12B-like n=1 Tax=Saccostrea cuccullata TaxID=36930 RepID=UPI002ED4F4AD
MGSKQSKEVESNQSKEVELKQSKEVELSFIAPHLVAAIDFGTTYSGYAFSFRVDFDQDPSRIKAYNWIAGSQSLISHKAPSVILLKPDKTFDSFGYDAEDKYASLTELSEHEGWLYFKRFKMTLHNNKRLGRSTLIKDINGIEMPAIAIFTMAIKFLKEHLMETLEKVADNCTEDLIQWVLTVPAIWDEGAKQFMMEAAEDAGIERKQLMLALEPEAASIYCNVGHIGFKSIRGKTESYKFTTGTRYMVLDLGGGTADITVHEVQPNQTLREIHYATGGAWGGTKVDEAFYQFLVKLFGNDVLTKFKTDNMEDYISLFRNFEIKKRTVNTDLEKWMTIVIPLNLLDIFKNETGETLEEVLPQTMYAEKVIFKKDRIRVHPEIFKEFFKDTIQGIIEHITEIMISFEGKSVSNILLVGGFSESPMVLKAIKELFPDKKVIAPADPELAVLKGAVLFGHMPSVISSRISRYSIGFEVGVPFIEGSHREEYKYKRPEDGRSMCRHIFQALVQKGEEVPTGHKVIKMYTPNDEDAETGIGIYQSTSEDPTYTTEENCTKIGAIKLHRPNGGWPKGSLIKAVVEFGGTQFDVTVTDDTLNETYTHSYDFLRN